MVKSKTVVIQRDRCTGCGLCQLVCSYEKEGRFTPCKSRIKIPGDDAEGFFPMICRNCEDAPCLDACPAGAMVRRREDGYVLLLTDRCIGCNMCVMVCPFNAISCGEGNNYKCDTCGHLEKCARICPHGAIAFDGMEKETGFKRRKLAGFLTGKTGGMGKW